MSEPIEIPSKVDIDAQETERLAQSWGRIVAAEKRIETLLDRLIERDAAA